MGLSSWGRVFSSLLGSGEPWKCSEQETSADIVWDYSGQWDTNASWGLLRKGWGDGV